LAFEGFDGVLEFFDFAPVGIGVDGSVVDFEPAKNGVGFGYAGLGAGSE
jgi:hypothetical protein